MAGGNACNTCNAWTTTVASSSSSAANATGVASFPPEARRQMRAWARTSGLAWRAMRAKVGPAAGPSLAAVASDSGFSVSTCNERSSEGMGTRGWVGGVAGGISPLQAPKESQTSMTKQSVGVHFTSSCRHGWRRELYPLPHPRRGEGGFSMSAGNHIPGCRSRRC